MTTLAEQLNQLAQHEQRQENLANAIEKLVSQPRIFNMLKKALVNKFSAKIPYQKYNDKGHIELEPFETSQFSSYNSYKFTIEIEPEKTALEVRIIFDGKIVNVLVVEYDDTTLTQETIIDLLKQVIGVENKVK